MNQEEIIDSKEINKFRVSEKRKQLFLLKAVAKHKNKYDYTKSDFTKNKIEIFRQLIYNTRHYYIEICGR